MIDRHDTPIADFRDREVSSNIKGLWRILSTNIRMLCIRVAALYYMCNVKS